MHLFHLSLLAMKSSRMRGRGGASSPHGGLFSVCCCLDRSAAVDVRRCHRSHNGASQLQLCSRWLVYLSSGGTRVLRCLAVPPLPASAAAGGGSADAAAPLQSAGEKMALKPLRLCGSRGSASFVQQEQKLVGDRWLVAKDDAALLCNLHSQSCGTGSCNLHRLPHHLVEPLALQTPCQPILRMGRIGIPEQSLFAGGIGSSEGSVCIPWLALWRDFDGECYWLDCSCVGDDAVSLLCCCSWTSPLCQICASLETKIVHRCIAHSR
jgi:hypothetical protein